MRTDIQMIHKAVDEKLYIAVDYATERIAHQVGRRLKSRREAVMAAVAHRHGRR